MDMKINLAYWLYIAIRRLKIIQKYLIKAGSIQQGFKLEFILIKASFITELFVGTSECVYVLAFVCKS